MHPLSCGLSRLRFTSLSQKHVAGEEWQSHKELVAEGTDTIEYVVLQIKKRLFSIHRMLHASHTDLGTQILKESVRADNARITGRCLLHDPLVYGPGTSSPVPAPLDNIQLGRNVPGIAVVITDSGSLGHR